MGIRARTNTEETWWCTDPLNANSDGDAQVYSDGTEVDALLDFTLSRTVRWGYGPPSGPPNAWPNFNDRTGTHAVSYTHLRAHETVLDLVCRLLLEKKNKYLNSTRSRTHTQ